MYNVVLLLGVEQSDSVINTLHAFVLLQILSHIGYYRILSRVPCATQ